MISDWLREDSALLFLLLKIGFYLRRWCWHNFSLKFCYPDFTTISVSIILLKPLRDAFKQTYYTICASNDLQHTNISGAEARIPS